VHEHLVQVANIRVIGSRSNFLWTVQISQGMAGPVDFLSAVSRRRFKSPRTALHHGLVTCPKTFKIIMIQYAFPCIQYFSPVSMVADALFRSSFIL
jgi:hypothetical protein